MTSDVDDNDRPFITGERTVEGFFRTRAGIDQAISRGLAYAPYADLIWCETSTPNLEYARKFAEAIHRQFPGKLLAYNCSPSFNWKKNLDDATIAKFQRELGAMGYKFQFITLAGFHALNYGMFELAHGYARRQMSAFVELQQKEFAAAEIGFTAVKHQREVGTGYFDAVTQTIEGGQSSTTALTGSTEEAQFEHGAAARQAGRLTRRAARPALPEFAVTVVCSSCCRVDLRVPAGTLFWQCSNPNLLESKPASAGGGEGRAGRTAVFYALTDTGAQHGEIVGVGGGCL